MVRWCASSGISPKPRPKSKFMIMLCTYILQQYICIYIYIDHSWWSMCMFAWMMCRLSDVYFISLARITYKHTFRHCVCVVCIEWCARTLFVCCAHKTGWRSAGDDARAWWLKQGYLWAKYPPSKHPHRAFCAAILPSHHKHEIRLHSHFLFNAPTNTHMPFQHQLLTKHIVCLCVCINALYTTNHFFRRP